MSRSPPPPFTPARDDEDDVVVWPAAHPAHPVQPARLEVEPAAEALPGVVLADHEVAGCVLIPVPGDHLKAERAQLRHRGPEPTGVPRRRADRRTELDSMRGSRDRLGVIERPVPTDEVAARLSKAVPREERLAAEAVELVERRYDCLRVAEV